MCLQNLHSRFRPRLRLKQDQNPDESSDIDEIVSSGRFAGVVAVVFTIWTSC